MKPVLWLSSAALLFTLSSVSGAYPTAVFTLDAKQAVVAPKPGRPTALQFSEWARSCAIVPGGALFVLHCEELPDSPLLLETDSGEGVDVTLALFRDLDETVYLAGCPDLEKLTSRAAKSHGRSASESDLGSRKKEATESEAGAEDCRDIQPAQTFTTEVEGDELRIVIRGRQLTFSIFRLISKPPSPGSPYELPSSTTSAPIGPSTTSPGEGLQPDTPPTFQLPGLRSASAGSPAEGSSSAMPRARTDLRTGQLILECKSSRARVWIDTAFMGACPLETNLVEGRHRLRVERPGQPAVRQEFEVEAGQALRLKIGH